MTQTAASMMTKSTGIRQVGAGRAALREPVLGVHAEVAAVEHGVHIRSEQQAVVEPGLAAVGDRADVRCLEHGRDVRFR